VVRSWYCDHLVYRGAVVEVAAAGVAAAAGPLEDCGSRFVGFVGEQKFVKRRVLMGEIVKGKK
jgi:hypothetical protein